MQTHGHMKQQIFLEALLLKYYGFVVLIAFAYHIVLEFRIGNVRLYYYGIVVKLDSLEFTPGFKWRSVTRSLVLCVCIVL
jgi:hypothetical protein